MAGAGRGGLSEMDLGLLWCGLWVGQVVVGKVE